MIDGKSLRLLGLIAGLTGLWWLLGPANGPSGRAQTDLVAAAPGPTVAAEKDAFVTALWSAQLDEIVRLLAAGTTANQPLDARATRPLHVLFYGGACASGQSGPEVIAIADLLLEAGAQVNAVDQRGTSPLMLAAARCGGEVTRRLLTAGADMQQTNLLGLTAFEMTLVNRTDGGVELARAGFRLDPGQYAHYRSVYHDEAAILAHLELVAPAAN